MKKLIPFFFICLLTFEPAYSVSSCQCVAFRLDDVQDYWVNNSQIAVMDVFHKKNASITIGVIGNHFGHDLKLIKYVKNNKSLIEIANHGWNHENFTDFSREQQSIMIGKTDQKLAKLFGLKPTIFIPPFDSSNSDTISAVKENNLQTISSDVDQDMPYFHMRNNDTYHIPGNTYTSNLTDMDTNWQHYSHKYLFVKIMESIQRYGYAVVVMHPQEYSVRQNLSYLNAVDKNQTRDLELLINDLQKNGIKILPISQIPSNMNKKPHPFWMNNVFNWYEQGKINSGQVISVINYLK